jgi:hypothetical protein
VQKARIKIKNQNIKFIMQLDFLVLNPEFLVEAPILPIIVIIEIIFRIISTQMNVNQPSAIRVINFDFKQANNCV